MPFLTDSPSEDDEPNDPPRQPPPGGSSQSSPQDQSSRPTWETPPGELTPESHAAWQRLQPSRPILDPEYYLSNIVRDTARHIRELQEFSQKEDEDDEAEFEIYEDLQGWAKRECLVITRHHMSIWERAQAYANDLSEYQEMLAMAGYQVDYRPVERAFVLLDRNCGRALRAIDEPHGNSLALRILSVMYDVQRAAIDDMIDRGMQEELNRRLAENEEDAVEEAERREAKEAAEAAYLAQIEAEEDARQEATRRRREYEAAEAAKLAQIEADELMQGMSNHHQDLSASTSLV